MKKVLLSILASAFCYAGMAQCSQEPNGFEVRLTSTQSKNLLLQVRHSQSADIKSAAPNSKLGIFGMICAVSWPSTSAITIDTCTPLSKEINLIIDKNVVEQQAKNKAEVNTDKFVTLYHRTADDMPVPFTEDWQDGEWHDVAMISYSGNLNNGDAFALMNCDYGLVHPNSYSGNSHTDPWFAVMSAAGTYAEFSPKMSTILPKEVATEISCVVFPNPASTTMGVELTSNVSTEVMLQLTDVNGKIVRTKVEAAQLGANKYKLDVADLADGTYMLKVTDGKTISYLVKVSKQS
jgi:hypothetical protein